MSYFEFAAIRASCPVVQQNLPAAELVQVTRRNEWEPDSGFAQCRVPSEVFALIPGFWGCRNVTDVSSIGCPLRNGDQVKVKCLPTTPDSPASP